MIKKWWHNKIAYQIYPKSFYDSNGDGIGDIRGVINKLDYLKELGIDIIWISPIFTSPFVDQGYDISDYYGISPVFGTMEDIEELLSESKKRGMYILLDLVVNHCSDQHEWFQKALKDPDGEYADYFFFREGKDGKEPCNWRSYFGGNVWEKVPGTNKYYFHAFAKEQPDLNWENPVVRREIYKMVNWWLDKGIAGFRIDAIVNIKKDLRFEDYPADRADGMADVRRMLDETEGLIEMLNELKRETFDKYDALTVGELFNYKKDELALYIGPEGCFSTIFDFDTNLIGDDPRGWYAHAEVSPKAYRDTILAGHKVSEGVGMMSNVFENHDEPRGVSRYINQDPPSEEAKKMLALLLMLIRGIPFIYQGQEIGMTNKQFKMIDEIDDIHTRSEYQIALDAGKTPQEAMAIVSKYCRDNARTPFHWSAEANAGFSSGTPWLALNENYSEINLAAQVNDPNSLWQFYRKLISLRRDSAYSDLIVYGELEPIALEKDNLFAFYRRIGRKRILVVANYQDCNDVLTLDHSLKSILINNYDGLKAEGKTLKLQPFQAFAAEV